jgi:ATP synthase protein I
LKKGSIVTQPLALAGKKLARKTVLSQLVVSLCTALLAFLVSQTDAALAALLGSFSALIPNALFGWIAFRYAGARANQQVVKSFFVGEGVKLVLTAVLLSLVLLLTNSNALWLLTGFILAVVAQWIAPILFLKST